MFDFGSLRELPNYTLTNCEIWAEGAWHSSASIDVVGGKLRRIEPVASDLGREGESDRKIDPSDAGAGAAEIIDAGGLIVMPAGIDAQVHLRVPGQAHKETAEMGLAAALLGGYAAVLTMPNTNPTVDSVDVLRLGQAEVKPYEEKFGIRVFWTAAITKKLNSDFPTDFGALAASGVKAFTNDGLGVASDSVMNHAFAKLASLGLPLLQHAEFAGHGGSLAPGPAQRAVGAKPYYSEPEWKMVERDLRELRKTPGARYHVLHVSSAKTVDLIRQAKREGLRVSGEVTPHHLYFNSETVDPKNTAFKMNPPLRSVEDQRALWEGLADGTLDFVATDHAPHEVAVKTGAFDDLAFGTLGMDTTMSVLIWGLKQKMITRERLLEVWATNPARFLGLDKDLGGFKIGEAFHAVLVDFEAPERPYGITRLPGLAKNSCFLGAEMPGRVAGACHGTKVYRFFEA